MLTLIRFTRMSLEMRQAENNNQGEWPMIVNEETINQGYMLVEKYMVVPKSGIIIPGVQGMYPHALQARCFFSALSGSRL